MMNAVRRHRDCRQRSQMHIVELSRVQRCFMSLWGSASEANRASSKLSHANGAVWDAKCCITSSCWFRSSSCLPCWVVLVSTGLPRGNHGWRFTARCKFVWPRSIFSEVIWVRTLLCIKGTAWLLLSAEIFCLTHALLTPLVMQKWLGELFRLLPARRVIPLHRKWFGELY